MSRNVEQDEAIAGPHEEPLGRAEAFYRKVLEQSADITSVLGPDGKRRFISSGVRAVLGFTEEEALSLKVAESTHPDDQVRVLATFKRLLGTPGASERLRFRQRRKDGSWVLVDALVRNACDDPVVGGVIVTTRDVTEQVRLEQQFFQAQKLESVGRLAGGVAHDFNNLLTVILSSVELLRRKVGGAEGELVEDVAQAGERARVLTRQLLAFARKDVATPEPLDLSAQVRASERLLRRLLGEDVELVVRLEPHPHLVLCDASQLDQVLLNLAVNARDAMPTGGRLTIETANVPGEGGAQDQVRLTLRDTGVGLSADAKQHLFEPFFTTKPSGKGTGLGLATVHGIVQQHGGRLEVDSEPGQGAAFSAFFPRVQAVSKPAPPPHEAPRAHQDARILLVEDDSSVRHMAERALLSAGYRVMPAVDAESARQLLGDPGLAPDLVVTDVVLPDSDGLRVAADVRRLRPGTPVLFTSGYTADRLAEARLDPEFDFLPKPFTPSVLLRRVQAALDRQPRASATVS